MGVRTHAIATFETIPRASRALEKALCDAETFDWLVLTSSTSVRILAARRDWNVLHTRIPRVAVVGATTAKVAREAGMKVGFVPSDADGLALAKGLLDAYSKKVLLLRAKIGSDQVVETLTERGAHVTDIALYDTKILKGRDARLEKILADKRAKSIMFASPSAVRGFSGRISKSALKYSQTLPVLAIGLATAETARKSGFKNVAIPRPFTLRKIVRTLHTL